MAKQKKPVQCSECEQVFKSAQGLGGHLRLKHGKRVLTKARVLSKPAPVLVSAERVASMAHCQAKLVQFQTQLMTMKQDLDELREVGMRAIAEGKPLALKKALEKIHDKYSS